jgi:hypothetical protein
VRLCEVVAQLPIETEARTSGQFPLSSLAGAMR